MARTTRTDAEEEWISMREACDLLGVSPATVRRWSDSGKLRAFTTPGGHRRFARAAVLDLLPPAPGQRPPLGGLGLTAARMSELYLRQMSDAGASTSALDLEGDHLEALSHHWDEIVTAIHAAVDADCPEDRRSAIQRGSNAAREHGRITAVQGACSIENLTSFLNWRRIFLAELATACRRRALDTAATCDLMLATTRSFDEFVPALLDGHESATVASVPPPGSL